jgi:hypothetical protein
MNRIRKLISFSTSSSMEARISYSSQKVRIVNRKPGEKLPKKRIWVAMRYPTRFSLVPSLQGHESKSY